MNCIGIDLGTTNSVVCTIRHGRYEYLNFNGSDLLPSAILYKSGKISVGIPAKRKAAISAENYISSAKSHMGDNNHTWNIEDRIFTPTDVATEVLTAIHTAAKEYFGNDEPIQAVITTPAYFRSAQNMATEKAGQAAGFIVKQVLPEPVAAALAYAYDDNTANEKIYVVDLGGGTFDVTLLEKQGSNKFKTLMKDGDAALGGDNFDESIRELMLKHIRRDIGVDLSTLEKSDLDGKSYRKAMQKMLDEAEKVKIVLSDAEEEYISRPNLFPTCNGNYDLDMSITRDDFMNAAKKYVKKVEDTIKRSFDKIDIKPKDVDRVILVGGSANMPFVRKYVTEFFGKEPYANMDLSKLVAMGAALKACDEDETIMIEDIIAHSLGVEIVGNRMSILLKKNTPYPTPETKEVYTTSVDYQDSVDINIYEGEDTEDVDNNNFCGGFTLDNIERNLAGVPKIEVSFRFDESCILHVTAKDLNTGSSNAEEIEIETGEKKKKPEGVKAEPFNIMILLDRSGSMSGAMDTAKAACKELVRDHIDLGIHRTGFISFGDFSIVHCDLSQSIDELLNAINLVYASGCTDMLNAFRDADRKLSSMSGNKLVIIVTDGSPYTGNTYRDRNDTKDMADNLKSKGIKIICIGAGRVDHEYLSTLASSIDDYYGIENMSELSDVFKTIAHGLKLR